MSFISRIGDFFRTPFESDEETKRRKQREAQEAAARAKQQQAQKPTPQPTQSQQPVVDLFKPKQNTGDPLGVMQKLQQNQPPAKPQPAAPKPAPLPDQQFSTIKTVSQDQKKILGWNAAAILPKGYEKVDKVKVEGEYSTNKDKFIAQFDQMDDERKKIYVQGVREKAAKGDKAAQNSLKALQDANREKAGQDDALQNAADAASVPGRSILRVATGIGQGVSGLYDLATPGEGTNRTSKFLDNVAKNQDKSAKEAGVEDAYKVGNVVGEIASFFIPAVGAAKIASKFPKGAKITEEMVELIAKNVDNAGDAGKVRQFLANRMRSGWTLDQAIEETLQSAKYTGQNASQGKDTSFGSVAGDVATSVGGSLLFPGKLVKGKIDWDNFGENAYDDVVGGTVAAVGDAAERQLTRNADELAGGADDALQRAEREAEEKGLQNISDDDLKQLADDQSTTALDRKRARDEAIRRADASEQAAFDADPLNRPAYQAKQDAENIVRKVEDRLNDYFNLNPQLTQQQREAAIEAARKKANDLVEELKESRYAAIRAVDNQGDKVDETIKAGEDAVAQADEVQAAATNPTGSNVVEATPAQASPEVQANNAYQSYADASTAVVDAIGEGSDEIKRGNFLYNNPLTKLFNKTQQAYIETVDGARQSASDIIQSGIQSKNAITRGTPEVARMFFKNFGQSEPVRNTLIKRTSHLQNSGRVAKVALDKMEAAVKEAGDPATVYERIYRVLEEPEFLQRVFGDANKLDISDLSGEERRAFDQLINLNKIRNDINLQTGIITPDLHAKYADGMHSPRIYDINVEHPDMAGFVGSSRYLDLKAKIKRKDIADVPDYVLSQLVDSPFQASALRLESSLKNLANKEALDNLDNLGGLPAKAPNKNFVQLEGKKYGQHEGKYIDKQLLSQIDNKDYYNSQLGQQLGDSINTFHNSILGAPGRLLKKFRTTLSPGTFVGNVGSGQFAFSGASNINPVTSMARTAQAAKQLADKGINPHVQEAELAGLFAGDTGRMLTNSKEPTSAIRKGKDNLWDKTNNVYGGVDKASALGWYNEFRARGLSPEQAVARVHLGMQNYANAGRTVNALSDSPIFGKPFARFTPELLRIAKNAAIYNPVGTAAKGAGLYAGANYLSDKAGETPEERKAREEAPGQTKIGNLSLNIPVGDSSINIARAIGLNFPQEPNGDPASAITRQLNPVADMTRTNAQGETVFAPNQMFGDMFYRNIADQAVDRDFMGRQITDPKNKTYYEDGDASVKKYEGAPSANEQLKNRLRAAGMMLPGAPEADAVLNAASGNEDYYGKERSVPQAIARMFGVKVESNNKEARDKRADANRFFDEDLPAVQTFVRDNPDLAQKYYQIKNPTRTRPTDENDPGTKVSDMISPERWDVINSDTSGRLFNFLKTQDQRLHERSVAENQADPSKKIKPVDPVYQLPADQAKYVAELRSRPSGDDIEAQEILRATSNWYGAYEDRYHDYLTKNTEYFNSQPQFEGAAKDNPRVKAYGDVSAPVAQPEIIKQYYQIKNSDPDAAKEFYKANKDELSATFDSYAKDRLTRINALRKIEGYEPISLEVFKNKTFGFSVDDGSGFGFGNGKKEPYGNTLGELSNFTGTVNRLKETEVAGMPDLSRFFTGLTAGAGGGRGKPKLGAGNRGA